MRVGLGPNDGIAMEKKEIFELADVFNEAGLAEVTYVSPKEEKQLAGSLATTGKHVTLVGPSGSGKSTMANQILAKLELTESEVHSFSGRTYSQHTNFLEILAAEFDCEAEPLEIEEWLRVFRLIFIDDVHHLNLSARKDLASRLKLWHEKRIRFFMVGIAKTSDEILGEDPELAIRNDVWRLGVQNEDFMMSLMAKGERALDVTIPPESKRTAILAAQGSPSILQAICRIACVEAGVLRTGSQTVVAVELPLIRESVVHQYDGRYLAKVVNLARGRRQARSVHDTYFRIVEQIAANGKEQTSKDELYHKIVGSHAASRKAPIRNSFYRAMNNLPAVIQEHGLNDILIYENDTLTIDDPVFRFYLDHLDFSRVRSQVNIRRLGFEYDVALSFAGEDRVVVEELAGELRNRGLEVFYDFDQKATLWGKDLRKELQKTYQQDAQFMVIFLSEHYPEKDWTQFELEVGRTASAKRTEDYLLPLVIGDERPPIVGLPASIGHISLDQMSIPGVADLIQDKIATLPPLDVE